MPVAAQVPSSRPASSLSSRITMSRPANAATHSSVHLPAATHVAQCPSSATRSASFSPSQTKTVASGYFSNSGKRYRTRRSSSFQIHPPLPSGLRCRKSFGSRPQHLIKQCAVGVAYSHMLRQFCSLAFRIGCAPPLACNSTLNVFV